MATARTGPEIWVSREDGPDDSAPVPVPAPAQFERPCSARALLRLLRLAALTVEPGRSRRSDLLHSLLMLVLYTAAMVFSVCDGARNFTRYLEAGRPIVDAAMFTGYAGVMFFLMWVLLACGLVAGRRRYGRVMSSSERALQRAAGLSSFRCAANTLGKHTAFLLTGVVALYTYIALNGFFWFINISDILSTSAWSIVTMISISVIDCGARLAPIKFALAALELLSGYRAVARELSDMCQAKRPPSASELGHLRAIYADLSEAFSELTDAMSAELVVSMCHGTLSAISVSLVAICGALRDAVALTAPLVVLYGLGAALSVLLPCEMAQWTLNTVGRTRRLLLRPRLQLSRLQHQLGLFTDAVSLDLDTLGDLGLFRLQRSTVLAITATIVTYIIVMVQFLVTELAATPPAP